MTTQTILCVDDDITVLNALRTVLVKALGSEVVVEIAEDGIDALEICSELLQQGQDLSVVISDFIMPSMRGDELLIRLHGMSPNTVKIMLTGQSDLQGIKRTINEANLYRFIEKPFRNDDIRLTAKSALQAYNQERELERQNAELKRMNDALKASERMLEGRVAQRTAELDEKNIALMQAIRSREDSERIARHDLKTPLGSIAAASTLLRGSRTINTDEEMLLGMIENAANRALGMVNLSLDLYRMENGTYVFRPLSVDLAGVVLAVVQDLKIHGMSKSVVIQVSGHESPMLAVADASLCYSIVSNLMKNAVEAAPEHSTVQVVLQDGPRIRLRIHNAGAVPLALRDRFFEKYATEGKVGGTGLGTYSARLMARVQGGSLVMETADELGTSLTLGLNRSTTPPPSQPAVALIPCAERLENLPGKCLRVLIVDDDPFNRMVLEKQLPQLPLEVETAINGRIALESVMRQRPDILFMDIEMPIMNGIEALGQIREFQKRTGQAPSMIVAFSSNDDAACHSRYLELGFDQCLSKPCLQQDVFSLLRSALDLATPEPTADASCVRVDLDMSEEIPHFLHSRRILVADMRQALAAEDWESVRKLAHKLAGSLGMFGFEWASRTCKEIESAVLKGEFPLIAAKATAVARHLETVEIHPVGRMGDKING
ncbi:histidine kinase [Gammaproteobacteria bacterium]